MCRTSEVLEMSVVGGMRGVGGLCEIYKCLAWEERGELIRGLSLDFNNNVRTGEC